MANIVIMIIQHKSMLPQHNTIFNRGKLGTIIVSHSVLNKKRVHVHKRLQGK